MKRGNYLADLINMFKEPTSGDRLWDELRLGNSEVTGNLLESSGVSQEVAAIICFLCFPSSKQTYGKTWSFHEKWMHSFILFLHPRIKTIIKSIFLKNYRSCFIWKRQQRPCPSRWESYAKSHLSVACPSDGHQTWSKSVSSLMIFLRNNPRRHSETIRYGMESKGTWHHPFNYNCLWSLRCKPMCDADFVLRDEINSINVPNPKPRKTQRLL